MLKPEYLKRLEFIRNDIRILTRVTFAGSVRVSLEAEDESISRLYNKINNMSEDQFKLVSD